MSQEEQRQEQRPGLEGHTGPITIGEALAVLGKTNPDKQIDVGVVSAIRSVEGRATGVREGIPGGPAAQAQQIIQQRTSGFQDEHRLGDILSRAEEFPALQRVVNMRDAKKVGEAEIRNNATGNMDPNGVAAALTRAAEYNVAEGHVNPQALAVLGKTNPDKQIDVAVVSAIRSVEGRATGVREGVPGGPAAQAQQIIQQRTSGFQDEHRLGHILSRAEEFPALQRVVNMRDAKKVGEAEIRNNATGNMDPNGVAAALTRAAEYNVAEGHVNPQAQ